MARKIENFLYMVKYHDSMMPEFVECNNLEDFYKYVAQKIINGRLPYSFNEINKDGSRPKVSVLTNKKFKEILKGYKNPEKYVDIDNLKINIESIGVLSYSDLTDYEKETITAQIKQGYNQGEFNTLSDRTDDDVLLKWSI